MREHWQLEMVKAIAPRYRKATRPEKSRLLDEFCAVTGFHRKYATRLLRKPPRPRLPRRRGRPRKSDNEGTRLLVSLWRHARYPSAAKLKKRLPELVTWARTRVEVRPKIARQLLDLSVRTIDRRLTPYRRRLAETGDPFERHRSSHSSVDKKGSGSVPKGNRAGGNNSLSATTKSSRLGAQPKEETAGTAAETPERESPMAFEIKTRQQKDVLIVSLKGEMVLGQDHFDLMKLVVKELKEGEDKFVVDMGKVTKMDSAGVGELVAVNVAAKEKGAQVHLANFEENVGKVLQMALIHKIIPSFDTQKEAIEAFD